jgi:hypothetical protein
VLPQNDHDKDSSVALALEAFSGNLSFQALFHCELLQLLPQNDKRFFMTNSSTPASHYMPIYGVVESSKISRIVLMQAST